MKGSLSFKMEKSIKKINDAVVQFQIANEIAREEAEKKQKAIKDHREQEEEEELKKQQQQQQQRQRHRSMKHSGKNQSGPNDLRSVSLSELMEQRMARQQRLEDGLFTSFFHQDAVSGLGGSPWADPKAVSPPRNSITGRSRRYPEPYAFVIH